MLKTTLASCAGRIGRRVSLHRPCPRGCHDYRAPNMCDWKEASPKITRMPLRHYSASFRHCSAAAEDIVENSNDDDDENDNDPEKERTKSIAEAIAEYKAQESLRIADKLEEARKEGEQAALARVEQDLILQQRKKAFEEWERNLAVAKKQQEEAVQAQRVSDNNHNTNTDDATVTDTTDASAHPVLGTILEDFGYKRLHVVPASVLENVPVWEKQRIYRHDRAKTMAADKMKTLHLGFPGIIGLFEDPDGGLAVIDGQHRIGMMKILGEKETGGLDLERVLVEVYPAPAEGDEESHAEYASEIFAEINKAEPVKKVDIFASKGDRKILVGGVEALKERYPAMFSPSLRCRPPNVNVDNLRDGLFASNVLKEQNVKSPKALYEWLQNQNLALKELYDDPKYVATVKVNAKALTKAQKNDFYLGLDPTYSWMSSS